RDQDDRGRRGRRGGRTRGADRARARGARLRRADDAGPAHQREADRHGRGAGARAAGAARRVHRAPPRAGRTIPHGTRKRAGAPAARGCGGPRGRRRGKWVRMRQWVPIPRRATAVPGRVRAWGGVGGHVGAPHLVIAATLARVAFVIALTLPPVRRAFSASGLGWVYLVVLAFALALVGVPLVRALAHWWGVLDRPAARKVHMTATPLLGGAAVYGAFAATVLFNFTFSLQLKGVAVGATIVVAVGLLDDVFDVPARGKLAGQAVAVAVAMAYGVVLDTVPTAWPGSGVINVALTLVWFLAVT